MVTKGLIGKEWVKWRQGQEAYIWPSCLSLTPQASGQCTHGAQCSTGIP